MRKPDNLYRFRVAFAKGLRVHHLDEYHASSKIALCRREDAKWIDMWITQDQLDAMPSDAWCPKCLAVIESL